MTDRMKSDATMKHVFTLRQLQAFDDDGNKLVIQVAKSGELVSATVFDPEGKEIRYERNEKFKLLLNLGDPQLDKFAVSMMASGCWVVIGGTPKFVIPCPY